MDNCSNDDEISDQIVYIGNGDPMQDMHVPHRIPRACEHKGDTKGGFQIEE